MAGELSRFEEIMLLHATAPVARPHLTTGSDGARCRREELCQATLTSAAVEIIQNSLSQQQLGKQKGKQQQQQRRRQPKWRQASRNARNMLFKWDLWKYFLHNRCASSVKKECTLGEYAELVVPPTAICPAVLDRQRSVNQAHKKSQVHHHHHHHQATHFQITPPDELSCPLLVFVNPKSGGRQGDRILRKFQYMLNPRQVYDLSKGGPKEGLTLFKDMPNFKVICCGGDGTVGWVLEAMDSIELATQPAIGVIPLGTGNDLARCLRWGGGYEGENIPKLMDKIKRASTVMLDRWSIEVTNTPPTVEELRPKVTLHSNMQKVIELSQSVVVDKSMIERFEEIQRQNFMSSSCSTDNMSTGKQAAPTAAASATSIMMATTTTTEYTQDMSAATNEDQAEAGGQAGGTRTTTTKSISMSTFETRRMQKTLIAAMSSSSSNTSSSSGSAAGSINTNLPQRCQQQQQNSPGHRSICSNQAQTEAIQLPPTRTDATERQSLETLLLQHKQQQLKLAAEAAAAADSADAAAAAEVVVVASASNAEAATDTAAVENNQSDDHNSQQYNVVKQQITLSLDLSDKCEANNSNNNNNNNEQEQQQQENRQLEAASTPQTPIRPTTPLAAAAAATTPTTIAAESAASSSNIPQKPIKVQSDKDCTVPYNIINNYFSVGVDAAICVKFHLEREKNPHKFNSRMKNKLWYFEYATSETFAASCKNLHENIEIVCDGVALDLANGPHLQGVALLNIPYTHGGSNLWGEHLSQKRIRKSAGPFGKSKKLKSSDKEFSATSFNSVDLSVAIQDFGDRLIEVIGLENCLHMGQVRTGLRASGRRLAQCSEVIIKTKKTFPMQIDGEPWMQMPCTVKVTHKNQVPMLMAPRSEKGRGFFNMLCS